MQDDSRQEARRQKKGLGFVDTLKRQSQCPGMHGLFENLSRESFDGGSLQSFREEIRGYHDFLRQKLPSLSILLQWSSISVASLMIPSIYL